MSLSVRMVQVRATCLNLLLCFPLQLKGGLIMKDYQDVVLASLLPRYFGHPYVIKIEKIHFLLRQKLSHYVTK
ncbi:hypothetical protein DN34_3209 [Vibrio cholerae]|nr:hypothetical protein DN34_3209 [Vibrio cholerae]